MQLPRKRQFQAGHCSHKAQSAGSQLQWTAATYNREGGGEIGGPEDVCQAGLSLQKILSHYAGAETYSAAIFFAHPCPSYRMDASLLHSCSWALRQNLEDEPSVDHNQAFWQAPVLCPLFWSGFTGACLQHEHTSVLCIPPVQRGSASNRNSWFPPYAPMQPHCTPRHACEPTAQESLERRIVLGNL